MRAFGKRYLITGASGLFGAMACLELSKRHEVRGIYHQHPVLVPRTPMQQLNLLDGQHLAEFLSGFRPDVLIHAAALVDVEYCEAHPKECVAMNQNLVRRVAEICRDLGIKMVSLSTDAFFQLPPGERAKEEMQPNLLTVYGRSKLQGEKDVLALAPGALVIRTNIYGWNALDKLSLAEWILDGLLHGKQLTMFQDVVYSPILVNSLVRAIEALLEAGESGIYHIAAKDSLTKLEFGRRVAQAFGLGEEGLLSSSVKEKKFLAQRSTNMSLDPGKFERRFPGLLKSVDEDLREFRLLLSRGVVDQLKGRRYLPELRGIHCA